MARRKREVFDGTPPSEISAAMIREVFNLPDDAVLITVCDRCPMGAVEVGVLTVGERQQEKIPNSAIPGNFIG